MKLSLKKKFGHIHVRGGRLLTVVHEHAVDARGQGVIQRDAEHGYGPVRNIGDSVTAFAGDLAIEIVNVKMNKVLGYSYLSGPATQLHNYVIRPDRYQDAVLAPAVLPDSPEGEVADDVAQAFFEKFRAACVAMKIDQDVDVFVLEMWMDTPEVGQAVMEMITEGYKLVPRHFPVESETQLRSHLLAVVHGGKPCYFMHIQPPKHASDTSALLFQSGLCLTALQEKA